MMKHLAKQLQSEISKRIRGYIEQCEIRNNRAYMVIVETRRYPKPPEITDYADTPSPRLDAVDFEYIEIQFRKRMDVNMAITGISTEGFDDGSLDLIGKHIQQMVNDWFDDVMRHTPQEVRR
jgi:hypothetical protein